MKTLARRRTRRRGFTLVELLVVISIIGMLMALLLPAVQSARESGRANTCRNNLRNLALAVTQFELKRNQYPGFVMDPYPADDTVAAGQHLTPRSWEFMLLPSLERMDIYEPYAVQGTTTPQPTQSLDLFICPSDPPEGITAATSYVVNTGQPDGTAPTLSLPRDFQANGVFHNGIKYDPADAVGTNIVAVTRMTSAYIGAGDGLQNTIMTTENVDAGTWVLDPLNPADWERYQGCVWWPLVSPGSTAGSNPPDGIPAPLPGARINELTGQGTTNVAMEWARPSAYHPGAVNVAFCDAHVRPLNQDIEYKVFGLLMSPRGRNTEFSDGSGIVDRVWRETILDEKDISY